MLKQLVKALLVFSLLILIAPSASFAMEFKCSESLISKSSPTIWQRTKSYGNDIIETKGVRLFLKESPLDTQEIKWKGFLTKQRLDLNKTGIRKFLSSVISFIPRKLGEAFSREEGYAFTPFAGLYNLTFKMPTEYLTNKFGNRKMEPAFFFRFPVVMTLSLGLYFQADALYEHKLQNHIQEQIAAHAADYNHDIQTDFRFHKIKEALNQGKISTQEAQHEAYLVSLAYSQYFEFRDSNNEIPTLESNMKLIDHYLFKHLKNVILNGVQKANLAEGFFVPDSALGKLSDSQKMELFNNNHQRYLKYQIVSEMVGQTQLWAQLQKSSKLQHVLESITKDPFTMELLQARDQGRITNDELQSYLQEDLYWQNRFQDWKTIGVTKLKSVNHHYINEALTLSDVREEILVEIASKQTITRN